MHVFPERAMTRLCLKTHARSSSVQTHGLVPRGFMIGGMAFPKEQELGQQYFDAANILVETMKRGDWEDYKLANPELYMYRHSIELTIKSLIAPGLKGHNLAALADRFESTVRQRSGHAVPGWITVRLKRILKQAALLLESAFPGNAVFRRPQNCPFVWRVSPSPSLLERASQYEAYE
jgi:hypothetical protein